MNLSTRQRNGIKLLGTLLLSAAAVWLIVVLAPYAAPLIAGLVVYSVTRPFARLLHGRLRVNNYVTAALCMLLIVGTLAVLLTLLIVSIVSEAQTLVETYPTWSQDLYRWLDSSFDIFQGQLELLHPRVSETIDSALRAGISQLTTFVSSLASRAVAAIAGIPQMLIFAVASSFCAFMFVADHDRIQGFFKRHAPERWITAFYELRDGLFSALWGYVRTQLVMVVVTFTELIIGFTVLRVDYAVLLALIIALMDMLPVFGAGLFLVPWAVYSLAAGDIFRGVGLGVLYAVTIVARQCVEPRLIGRRIGVYPVLTLGAMYAGLRLWGLLGLILGPVSVMVMKNVLGYTLGGKTLKEYLNSDPRAEKPAPEKGGAAQGGQSNAAAKERSGPAKDGAAWSGQNKTAAEEEPAAEQAGKGAG